MAADMFYTIYKTTNNVNNKIYIGQHMTRDLDDGYFGSGTMLKRAISKYGLDKFKTEILYVFDNFHDMDEMEASIVDKEFIERKDTYNMKTGGFQRGRLGEELKEHLSKKQKEWLINNDHPFLGKKHSEESIKKMSESSKGYVTSDKTKKKLSLAQQGDKAGNSKLTADDVVEIFRLRSLGMSLAKVAKNVGISKSQVWQIDKGNQWSHIDNPYNLR